MPAECKFVPGDVVSLISTGGLVPMTVERTTPVRGASHDIEYHIIFCAWFDLEHRLYRESFFDSLLVKHIEREG